MPYILSPAFRSLRLSYEILAFTSVVKFAYNPSNELYKFVTSDITWVWLIAALVSNWDFVTASYRSVPFATDLIWFEPILRLPVIELEPSIYNNPEISVDEAYPDDD